MLPLVVLELSSELDVVLTAGVADDSASNALKQPYNTTEVRMVVNGTSVSTMRGLSP